MNYNQTVTDYISKAPDNQIAILETLRELIHKSVPGTTEEIKWRMPVFKKTKNFTYLSFSKNHVTLGFYNLNEEQDPKKLLEGEGKTMRHVKIKSLEDIDQKQFSTWLKATAI